MSDGGKGRGGSVAYGGSADALKTVEILLDCIERLMDVLRETVKAEEAERIYAEFFGAL